MHYEIHKDTESTTEGGRDKLAQLLLDQSDLAIGKIAEI